jgi:pilus assembly protein Flp/PilA
MSQLVKFVNRFIGKEEEGATMVEYGIMVSLIAVVVMAAVGPLGIAIRTMFNNVAAAV